MKSLFEETNLKGLRLKNRFIRSATWENLADSNGYPTAELLKIYDELAQSGLGAIITGYAYVIQEEQPNPGMLGIYSDSLISGHQKITQIVHKYSSKIILQAAYGGSRTKFAVYGREIWGPSAIPQKTTGVIPKAMASQDIKTLIEAFAKTGERAKQAGYDGIQIHVAHGYLLSQFLSPYYNRREDEYGGSIENRARIILEIYQAVRKRVGLEFNIWIKINCSDFEENGATFAECQYVCRKLADMGIDAIEISGGLNDIAGTVGRGTLYKEYAALLAEELDTPIILVGGNRDINNMQNILQNTKIQYFAMSRPLLREPDLLKRWQEGDLTESKCIICNKCRSSEGNYCVFRE